MSSQLEVLEMVVTSEVMLKRCMLEGRLALYLAESLIGNHTKQGPKAGWASEGYCIWQLI